MDQESIRRSFFLPRAASDQPAGAGGTATRAAAGEALSNAGFNLKIEIGGTCALLPSIDGKSMFVFLPSPRALPRIPGIPRHIPVVKFNLADVPGAEAVPFDSDGLWELQGEDLRIDVPGQPAEAALEIVGFERQDGKVRVPPLPSPARKEQLTPSFGWVSSVEEACERRGHQGAGRIAGEFLEPLLEDRHADLLGARLLLTTGRIRPHSFLQGTDATFVVCRYRPFNAVEKDARDHRQLVVASLMLEIPISGESVTFRSTSLRTGKSKHELVLRPSRPGADVNVIIMNEEAEAILGLDQPPPFDVDRGRIEDRIFEMYAAFCPGAEVLREQDLLPMPIASEFLAIPRELVDGMITGPLRGCVPCSPCQLGLPVSP